MRKGLEIGKWMPLEIEPFLSSPAVRAMKDFQRWWYMELLLRGWQNVTRPCSIPNDSGRLWMMAGAWNKKFFLEHSGIVLAQFDQSGDGQWLVNAKQLEVYQAQIAKHQKYVAAAHRRWEKERGEEHTHNAHASHERCNAIYSSECDSALDFNSSLKKSAERKLSSFPAAETYMQRIRALGFRHSKAIAAEHALVQELTNGADPEAMIAKLAQIFLWTDSGTFVHSLEEAIRRWEEPQNLWQRSNNNGNNHKPSRSAAIDAAFADYLAKETGGPLEDRTAGVDKKG